MITTIVHVKVKEEFVTQFIEATITNHTHSIREKGNLRFDFLQHPVDSNSFVLYESYENDEQAKNHKNTAHYLKWKETVEPFMAQKRLGLTYKVIKP